MVSKPYLFQSDIMTKQPHISTLSDLITVSLVTNYQRISSSKQLHSLKLHPFICKNIFNWKVEMLNIWTKGHPMFSKHMKTFLVI